MFRVLLCPSSGARDYDVVYHIGRVVLGFLYVGGKVQLGWNGVRVTISRRARCLGHTSHCLDKKYIYIYIYIYIQGVPGGKDLTSGECSLGQTITI